MTKIWIAAAAAAMLAVGAAKATTIDFTTYASDTPLASVDGVSFYTYGGPGASGTPLVGLLQYPPGGLTNSTTPETVAYNNYPTNEDLSFTFSSPVSGVSFLFNNQGINGVSTVTAYDGMGSVLEVDNLGFTSPGTVALLSSGIKELVFDNGTGGGDSWIFDVSSITFSGTPEPATWAMMILGVAGIGAISRRRRTAGVLA